MPISWGCASNRRIPRSYFKQKFPEFYRKLDITYEEGSLEYSRLSSRTDYIGPLALVFNEILLQDR